MIQNAVTVRERGDGPYIQCVQAGRHALIADEPERAGGNDAGPGPYDYLLIALGACTAMQLRWHARRTNLELHQIMIELHHEATHASNGSRLDHFHRQIYLEGNLTAEQRADLLRVAEQCAVSRTLKNSSTVETSLASG